MSTSHTGDSLPLLNTRKKTPISTRSTRSARSARSTESAHHPRSPSTDNDTTSRSRSRSRGPSTSRASTTRPLHIDLDAIRDNDIDDMGLEYLSDDDRTPLKSDGSPVSYSAIDDEANRKLSVTDIARRPNESLYVKKCLLVNGEIDAMGMGRYQWYIWALCGLGYLLDLLIAQAFGLVLSPLEQEFGFNSNQSGTISVAFSIGMTFGAVFWGVLVDLVGRSYAYNCTVLISAVFGTLLGTSGSYASFLIFTVCVGFGVGGNIPIDTTITLENIPQGSRRLLPLLSIFQPIGVVMCTGLAAYFIPTYSCSPNFSELEPLPSCSAVPFGEDCCGKDGNNMGWRYLLYCVGAITSASWILRTLVFRFHESPKFLLTKGRDDQAVEVLQHISKFNGRECTITLEDFEKLTFEHEELYGKVDLAVADVKATYAEKLKHGLSRYQLLFSSGPVAWLTICVWMIYICDFFAFTVAGTFLPTVIAKKNAAIHVSLAETYWKYLFIYCPGIIGVTLGVLCYDLPRVGRKYTMVLSSLAMSGSLFLFVKINSQSANIGVNAMEYFFQSMFNSVLYGFTPEAFDAPIRGTACGIASFWGRLAGIISPLIAQRLLPSSAHAPASAYDSVLYLAGATALGCVIFTALLPNRMVGSQSM